MNDLIKSTNDKEDSYITPPNLLEEQKPFVLIGILFCDRNENKSKDFIGEFHEFTDNKGY